MTTGHVIQWAESDYRLELECNFKPDGRGRYLYSYKFWCKDELIFEGDDYSPPATHDENVWVADLLNWLSLQEDDVDEDYWTEHNYTPRQLEWRDSDDCNELKLIAMDLEETERN